MRTSIPAYGGGGADASLGGADSPVVGGVEPSVLASSKRAHRSNISSLISLLS